MTAPWPKLLLSKDIPEARISAFGYDADVVKFLGQAGQNKIGQHATNLLADLADMRFVAGFVRTVVARRNTAEVLIYHRWSSL